MVYMTEEEIKHDEFMILRNSICKSMKDINEVIEEEFKKKNILLLNKKKDNGYIKKDQKVDEKAKKKPDEKAKRKPDEKYMYQNEREKGNKVQ